MAVHKVEIQVDLNDQAAVQALNQFKSQFQNATKISQDMLTDAQRVESHAIQTKLAQQQYTILQQRERRDQEAHEQKLKQYQEDKNQKAINAQKAEENAQQTKEELAKKMLAKQKEKDEAYKSKLQLAGTQLGGQLLTGYASTQMGMATASDAGGVISSLSGGVGQGIGNLGGFLSNAGFGKTGSIVQTAGSLVPIIGQGVANAIGQIYSRFTEVAQYELPKMISSYRLGSQDVAKTAPTIGGQFGYSMGETLSNINAYSSAFGNRNFLNNEGVGRIFQDMRSAEMIGVNPLAVASFASLGGMGGAMQDENQMAGIARGVLKYATDRGMLGSQTERLLGAINSGIQGMASKGLAVDAEKLANYVIGVSNVGIKSVQGVGALRAIQGVESIAGQAKGGFVGNFQNIAMQALQAQAATESGGSPLGMIAKLEEYQTDPQRAIGIISKRLGKTVSKLALAGGGLSLPQIQALLGAKSGALGTEFDLTGEIGDQLDVTKKINKLETDRVMRSMDFVKTPAGQEQLDALIGIQQKLEMIIESIGTSELSTKLIGLADKITDWLK
jgi:hypothetical protein